MKIATRKQIIQLLVGAVLMVVAIETARVEESVRDKGDRVLGMAINTSKNTKFDRAFNMAKKAGLEHVQISVHWNEVESKAGVYDKKYFVDANKLYSTNKIKVSLNINPINTNQLILPKYLRGKSFDDPEVIEAFNALIDHELSIFRDVDIYSISVGNEVGGYLGEDAEKWEAYQTFFKAARDHIKGKKPDVPVGVKTMYHSMTGAPKDFVSEINQKTDVVMVTYYHWDGRQVRKPEKIKDIFDEIVELYPDRTIYFSEIGYPTSKHLGGSNEAQSKFVSAAFQAWDEHANRIKLLHFFMQHDLSEKQLSYYSKYYGLTSRNFLEYLGTIGMRTNRGKDKGAFKTFEKEAKLRGW